MKNKLRSEQVLTKNQSLVFEVLRKAKYPVGAYELLDQLVNTGLRAPLQIYRTLDQLIELRIVHRRRVERWTLVVMQTTPHRFLRYAMIVALLLNVDENLSSNIQKIQNGVFLRIINNLYPYDGTNAKPVG